MEEEEEEEEEDGVGSGFSGGTDGRARKNEVKRAVIAIAMVLGRWSQESDAAGADIEFSNESPHRQFHRGIFNDVARKRPLKVRTNGC